MPPTREKTNGWRNTAIGILSTAVIMSIGAMAVMGEGKADKVALEKHEAMPTHHEQRVINVRIEGRLKTLETGQDALKEQIRALPSQIVDEIQRRGP